MSQDAENLLEHDRIEEVLEAADPPQPVVMIEYSHKGLTWYLLLALIAIVTIGGLWLYHKKQLEDVETQARYARRELDRLKRKASTSPCRENSAWPLVRLRRRPLLRHRRTIRVPLRPPRPPQSPRPFRTCLPS